MEVGQERSPPLPAAGHPRALGVRDLPWAKRKGACKLNRKRPGRHKLQWVGPIAGVDPLRLFLMRPATDQHQAFYDVARKLLEDGLPK